MSPLGDHGILPRSVNDAPNQEHATSIIDTTHIFNPYTNRYQPISIASHKKLSTTRQTFLRSRDNDHHFWIGDDMSTQPSKNCSRIVFIIQMEASVPKTLILSTTNLHLICHVTCIF